MNAIFLAIDIGGTYIKGAIVDSEVYDKFLKKRGSVTIGQLFEKKGKIPSPFSGEADSECFINAILELVKSLNPVGTHLKGIGISCSGVVNYHGTMVEKTTKALVVLKNKDWKPYLESYYSCPVALINDNDAAAIGMAELNYLKGPSTIGVMTIGTGLGFTIWRNGRRWRPGGSLPLLGSIYTPGGSYNELGSALRRERDDYFKHLAGIITTAAILYHLDEVYIAGGLVDAASSVGVDISGQLAFYMKEMAVESDKPVDVKIIREGNALQLLGATSLISGELEAKRLKKTPDYQSMGTELPYKKELLLHQCEAIEIAGLLLTAENEAGAQLLESIPIISMVAEKLANSLRRGGRLIYVGAGTSGRVAAMDAVEIPCTYGLSRDRVLAIIAGGVSDASVEIESNFEEDASGVPELLLLNINEQDTVIGISASGSAYFVQSALAFARSRGSYTAMIQSVASPEGLPFCDAVIPLHSGYEVVAGSTRMKAGTATKKVLNCLTSTAMILNGEVIGPYMIGLSCINNKLIARAQAILKEVYDISEQDSAKLLQENDLDMRKVVGLLKQK